MRNVVTLAFIEKVCQAASLLLVQSMLARNLGPTGYGAWQYALSTINLVGSLALVCSSEILVAAIIRHRDDTREWLWAGFILRLLVGATCMVAVGLYLMSNLPREYYAFSLILSSLLVLAEPFAISIAFFQAAQRYSVISTTRLIILAAKIAVLLIALNLHMDIAVIAIIWVFEFVCFNLLVFRHLARENLLRPALQPRMLLTLIKSGTTVWVGFCFMYLIQRADLLILKRSTNLEILGHYAAPKALIDSWYGFGWLLSQILSPVLVYPTKTRTARLKLLWIMTGLSSAAALATTFAAKPILHLLFGKPYMEFSYVLVGLTWAGVLVFSDAALSSFYFQKQRHGLFMAKFLAGACAYFLTLALQSPIQPSSFIAAITAAYATCVVFSILYLRTEKFNEEAYCIPAERP